MTSTCEVPLKQQTYTLIKTTQNWGRIYFIHRKIFQILDWNITIDVFMGIKKKKKRKILNGMGNWLGVGIGLFYWFDTLCVIFSLLASVVL